MILLRLMAVSALALGVANCSSMTGSAKVDPKYGVKPSPRVVPNGVRAPKGGGRAVVGKPYKVAGKTFTPKEAEDYVAVGTASWYGSNFHGRKTANGEIFDKHSIAAAHPTLPLPSYVRVTNLSNKRSMVVRVNDRGPFHGNRLIDLSKGAAEALDFHRQGTARVKVEYVGRASLKGSDDRKLLATLQNGAPAVIPTAAPTPVSPQPASVLLASAQSPLTAAEAPVQIASAQGLPSAALTSSSTTMHYTENGQGLEKAGLNALIHEVSKPEARVQVAAMMGAFEAMPLPPSRPIDLSSYRRLTASVSDAVRTQDFAPRPRVASRPVAAVSLSGKSDPVGAFFEPMPLSQLTPQHFTKMGTNKNR